jgi:O-antigen/teichoic acid export membrane protein
VLAIAIQEDHDAGGLINMPGVARKLASGFFFRFANTVATAVVSVFIMPFIVHSLGDRDYGIWTLVATFVGYYGVLELGLSAAVSRYLARSLGAGDHEDCNRVFNTSLRLYVGIGFVALPLSALVAALAPWVCHNPTDVALFWKLTLILGTSIALMFPSRVFKGLLEAHFRFDIAAALDLISLALRTALIFPIIFAGYGVVGLAWVTLFAGIPSMLLQIYYAYRELPFLCFDRRYWTGDTARSLFSYSAYSLIANLANILRFKVDALVVAGYVGLVAVTHYRVGGVLTQYFFELMSTMFGVFPSVFSRQEGANDYEALKRTFFFANKCAICVSSFIGFGMLAWGKPFIVRWMGPQYEDSYLVTVLLVTGVTVSLWQGPSVSLLYGISKHRFYAIFNSLEGVANLALSLLFVRWYGMYGVALGTLVPIVISRIFIQPIYVCRLANLDFFEYLRRSTRTLAFVALSLVAPTLLSLRFAAPNYKVLFALGVVSAVLYGVPLWFFELTGHEAQILRGAIWPRMTAKEMSHATAE